MKKFVQVALDVIQQELTRQGVQEQPVKGTYEGVETIQLGDKVYAAVAGSALLVSNNEAALHAALDLHLGKAKKSLADVPAVSEAAGLLPPDPLARLYVGMVKVQASDGYKALYGNKDFVTVIANGTFVGALNRAKFVCAGLYRDQDGLLLAGRLPADLDAVGPIRAVHVPPAGQVGSRPLLAPKGVLYSESFFLDPAPIWNDRTKIFDEKQVQQLEEFDKNSGKYLSGLQLSKFLTTAGAYHRVVVVNQPKSGYKKEPQQHFPAFAVVSELRDPETFERSMATVLRGAALLASTQVKLTIEEETYKDCAIVGYRFPEDAPLKNDVEDIRFNFSPCFTRVGNQYVVSSTMELCKELIDALQEEAKGAPGGSPNFREARAYSAGAAEILAAFEDFFVTQTILDQAVPPAEAKAQVAKLIELVRGIGDVTLEETFTDKAFAVALRWKLK
jgi:hypothetical protein